jgi:aspartyl-tRNA(Asn)/glutamyl-tRNA(Gln) amidotransferase subunit C
LKKSKTKTSASLGKVGKYGIIYIKENFLMKIKREDILHLAKLSDFSMSDSEIDNIGKDLENIISYISELDELDTDGVEPTYQVFEMENIWRDDEIKAQDALRDDLLALSKDVEDNQIKVPKVL